MRSFLEQYGISIFVLVIISIMVLTASPLGLSMENLVRNQIQKFANTAGEESWNNDDKESAMITGEAYAIYSDDDNSLTFIRAEEEPIVGETYDGKIISNVYSGFETETYESGELITTPWWEPDEGEIARKIETVCFKDVIKPVSCSAFFAGLEGCNLIDLTNLDTSNVTSMEKMFEHVGRSASNPIIIGLDKLNTSNVVTMEGMFDCAGLGSDSITLEGIENMNVSNVQNMKSMFVHFGRSTTNFELDLSNWDVSNVTNMKFMFKYAGRNANNFYLNVIDWDTTRVTDMGEMFSLTGKYSSTFTLEGIENFNTSNVTNNNNMFYETGKTAGYVAPSL